MYWRIFVLKEEFPKFRRKALLEIDTSMKKIEKLSVYLQASDFVVVDKKGEYRGMFTLRKIGFNFFKKDALGEGKLEDKIDKVSNFVDSSASLATALQIITKNEFDKIAIIKNSKGETKKVLGYLRHQEIYSAYYKQTKYLSAS